jgi:phosphatidyl-myo-inositol alpha-mannosyltransferase
MRIGLVCPYDISAPGGVQQLVLELAEELRVTGHQVVVIGAGAHPGGEGSVTVGRTRRVRANDSVAPITLSPSVRRTMRASLETVDVIHIHEPLVPLIGWIALGMDKPTVATFHADPPSWVRSLYSYLPVGRRLRLAVVTAVSPTAASALPEAWGPVRIVPNAIDVGSFALDVERHPRRVAFLGRDEPRKGLDVLLGAWPEIRSAVPDAELMVMGSTRDLDLGGVTFLGRVAGSEKREVLASSQVFVAPNRRGESFGIVVAEGLAAGCAVVASDLSAFRDVAGDAARYVTPGASDELASSVIQLLKGPEEAIQLRERGRKRAERYDWAVVGTEYVRSYEAALGLAAATGR